MSDIFQEVDEEVRREQLKKLWARYQYLVYGAAVVLVLSVGGWRAYDWWQTKKAAEAGAQFEAAITLSEQSKHSEAEAAFNKIAQDSTASYRELAQLRAAAELAETDPKAAVAAYDKVAENSSVRPDLRDLAALKAGSLLLDAGSYAEARARLEPLAGDGHTFKHTARELLALSAWRSGDANAAKQWIDKINTDPATPPDERNRMEMLSALLASEGKG
ncbi:MAG TPA: tetratricopeptide repeat protein [Xanthobacteraceae bacterium]|nr:tetratricopeptide repeat protein [Xanthobacteraceae bacterium]